MNFHGDKLLKNLDIVKTMRPIAETHGKPVSAVAIRFILDWLEGSVVLVGAKRPSQILGNIEGMDWKLSEEELYMLDKVSKNPENLGGGITKCNIFALHCLKNRHADAALCERRAA